MENHPCPLKIRASGFAGHLSAKPKSTTAENEQIDFLRVHLTAFVV